MPDYLSSILINSWIRSILLFSKALMFTPFSSRAEVDRSLTRQLLKFYWKWNYIFFIDLMNFQSCTRVCYKMIKTYQRLLAIHKSIGTNLGYYRWLATQDHIVSSAVLWSTTNVRIWCIHIRPFFWSCFLCRGCLPKPCTSRFLWH